MMDEKNVSESTEANAPVINEGAGNIDRGQESQPVDDQPSEETAKVKYNLKVPEGAEVDAGYVDEIASFAREQGLSPEAAQALLNRDAKFLADAKTQNEAQIQASREQWIAELKADEKFGGVNYEKNLKMAQRAWSKFGPQDVDLGPLGDHPVLIKAMWEVAKVMSEDTLIKGGTVVQPKPKTLAERMYPNMRSN